jgi:hypothetical protein
VFHQNRKGMRTISHPAAKNRIFCVRDMPRLGFGSGTGEPFVRICGSGFGALVCDGIDMESRENEL